MKRLDETATRIFNRLIADLPIGESKTIDNTDRAFMPVHVESLGEEIDGLQYSVAHYYEQCGDLCCDPDMVFNLDEDTGIVEVVSFQQASPPIYQNVDSVSAQAIRSMVEFANQWMRNIADQQGI